jgi:pyruvate dehydrogenase E1 component
MASYPHTQWMLGQLTAKLTRIANQQSQQHCLQHFQ